MIAVLALLPALGAPQETPAPKELPKVTYEDSGDFRLLVMDLERRFKGRVRFEKGIPSKEVSISVRDAGYFEALDALCRAHKEATYCPEDDDYSGRDDLSVSAGPWFEYKSSYHAHFKTAVVSMKRHLQATPRGESSHVQVEIALFGPPWTPVTWDSGAMLETRIDKAVAADGRDIRIPEDTDTPEDGMDLASGSNIRGNVNLRRVYLRDFDLSKGLKSLSGAIKLTAVETRVARLACEAGVSIETPKGRLSVDSVKKMEKEKEEERASWRIAFSFTPKEEAQEGRVGLAGVLLEEVIYDGDARWRRLDLPMKGWSFLVETNPLDRAPAWIKFKLITVEREHEIPFQFSNVAFRDY